MSVTPKSRNHVVIPAVRICSVSKKFRIYHEKRKRHEFFVYAAASAARRLGRRAVSAVGLARPVDSGWEDFWALKDVSFDVQPGEVVGIIGRNGAGKSTLLKILSRITEPTAGRIELNGRVSSLLEVGTGFNPELTGRENVYLNGAILGMSRAEIKRKFDEIVDFSGVERFIDTPVKRYSSGMSVRLAFAVAAHLEPEILIIDEVLAVGDAAFQKKCIGKMNSVARHDGRTILFVSHQLPAIQQLCRRCILMQDGTAAFDDVTEECLARYSQEVLTSGDKWIRSKDNETSALQFHSASVELIGEQPSLSIQVKVSLQSKRRHRPAFIAFDVLNSRGVTIMQAFPSCKPFVTHSQTEQSATVVVDLPPLIPDRYYLTLWAGSHYTETLDLVPTALSFEINESPTPSRTFPHNKEHGSIVPRCFLV